jgi:hypothetical protein
METIIPYVKEIFFGDEPEDNSGHIIGYHMNILGSEEPALDWPIKRDYQSLLRQMGRQGWRYLYRDKILDLSLPPNTYFAICPAPLLEDCFLAERTLNEEELRILKNGMKEIAEENGCRIF